MDRIKRLSTYHKIVLIVIAVMVIVFSILYPVAISKKGFEYNNSILIPSNETGNTIYSGKIQKVPVSFTVSPNKTVDFRYGEKYYGPYYIKEDPTAIAKDIPEMFPGTKIVGFELYCADKRIFRGCKVGLGSDFLLFDENGKRDLDIKIVFEDGTTNQIEPTVFDILSIMDGPTLTHKGNGTAWFDGTVLCVVTALLILFADELFHLSIGFRVADPDNAEPSDWELAGRYIGATLLPIIALVFYIMGLK